MSSLKKKQQTTSGLFLSATMQNVSVVTFDPLPTPNEIRESIPMSPGAAQFVNRSRETVRRILKGEDSRLLAIVGPCSIHNAEAALQYARQLKELALEVSRTMFVVMRVYLQKPRTRVGWPGFLDDPTLDGTFQTKKGIVQSRQLLLDITELGVPIATEMLGTTLEPQYLCDFVTWTCIGARTTESQVHRHLASGLSMPVGFKNSSDGNIQKAVDACVCASTSRSFIGIDGDGKPSVVRTRGNPCVGVVLRGSYDNGPNDQCVDETVEKMRQFDMDTGVIVDMAHGNSGKTIGGMIEAFERLNPSARGFMLESFLKEGKQALSNECAPAPDVSVTDPCLSMETTARLLRSLA